MIKKLGIFIIGLILMFTSIGKIDAASATISVQTSAGRVVVGNTVTVTVTVSSSVPLGSWEYTISYDTSRLKLTSGQSVVKDVTTNGTEKSRSYTYKFKAIKSGNANVTVKSYDVLDYDTTKSMSTSVGSRTISIITQEQLIASYSKDNNLKSITVDGYELTPSFNKDVTEYTVNVPSTVEKINLKATVNDSKSTLAGTGEKQVSEGDNFFELTVTAENGSEKKYKVNVKVEDPSPIVVRTTKGEEGTIVKRASSLTKPSTYTESTIIINEENIPAFTSEITNFTLVGIKVDNKEVELYIYNEEENSYTPYTEIGFNNITLFPLKYSNYPENYIKKEIEINGKSIEAYKFDENSDFYMIYGVNIETGEEHLYQYDSKENTVSRFNSEVEESLNLKIKNFTFIILVLGLESILLLIILIVTLMTKSRNKKIYKKFIREYEEKLKHKEDKKELEKIQDKETKNKKEKKLSDTQKIDNI